jgi:hypothetical protein
MVMSRDQTAGRSQIMKIENSSFERVGEFKYLGKSLTNQNSIQEEIKSRLKSGNACYYSVQNLVCSRLLAKNLKIKIYRTVWTGTENLAPTGIRSKDLSARSQSLYSLSYRGSHK